MYTLRENTAVAMIDAWLPCNKPPADGDVSVSKYTTTSQDRGSFFREGWGSRALVVQLTTLVFGCLNIKSWIMGRQKTLYLICVVVVSTTTSRPFCLPERKVLGTARHWLGQQFYRTSTPNKHSWLLVEGTTVSRSLPVSHKQASLLQG